MGAGFLVRDLIPFASIAEDLAAASIFGRGKGKIGFGIAGDGLPMKRAKKGHAPTTAGAGGEAFTDETGDRGFFAPAVVDDLAFRHPEAEADVVVGIHGQGL